MIVPGIGLVGLVTSCYLIAAYFGCGGLCGEGGGCDLVRASSYAEILGIKTPLFGVLFFAAALVLALANKRRLLIAWSAIGAGASLVFIGLQAFVIHAFCMYCLVVDASALALFAAAIYAPTIAPARRGRIAVAVAGALAVLATPALITRCESSPVMAGLPEVLAREQRPGQVTIVEFVDFECPFCRRLHATLKQVVAEYGNRVRVVRKHLPLPSIHANSTTAAHASCCAEEAGADGERMADALFTAPPEELTAEGCEHLAASLGVDLERYRSCIASDRPAARVAADGADAKAAGLKLSVPVFFIGPRKFSGAQPAETIRAAIDHELARL